MTTKTYIGLDVGEKRIGVAVADSAVRIAIAYDTIDVDGNELQAIAEIVTSQNADVIVVGLPRNQSGEETAQTAFVREFARNLEDMADQVVFQDESLTSVLAEKQLIEQKKPYEKGDIDRLAAALILQDYLEEQ